MVVAAWRTALTTRRGDALRTAQRVSAPQALKRLAVSTTLNAHKWALLGTHSSYARETRYEVPLSSTPSKDIAPFRMADVTDPTHDTVNGLFDESDDEDPFRDFDFDRDDRTSRKRKADSDKENGDLGVDEQIKITKKRRPMAKLDENRQVFTKLFASGRALI